MVTEEVLPARQPVSIRLDEAEVSTLLEPWELQPNTLSPLTELCQSQGEARAVDDIVKDARDLFEDELIERQLRVLSMPDRVIEVRQALFGTPPDVCRFYGSRKEQADYTVMRPHHVHDWEILLPYSEAELLQWFCLQNELSPGAETGVPTLVMNLPELTILLGMADAWKMAHAQSFLDQQAMEPGVFILESEELLEAVRRGLSMSDRRFLIPMVQELFGGLSRPGNLDPVHLGEPKPEELTAAMEYFESHALLEESEDSPGTWHMTSIFLNLAASFYTWIASMTFHDVQVVKADKSGVEAQEELLISWSTPTSMWLLGVDGLTGWKAGEEGLKFQLHSCGLGPAVETLQRYLQRLEASISEDFYLPIEFEEPEEAPEPEAVEECVCSDCGKPLKVSHKFCTACGGKKFKKASLTCQTCGQTLQEGSKFCSGCGTSTSSEPQPSITTCPTCEAPLKRGNKFCVSCGKRV